MHDLRERYEGDLLTGHVTKPDFSDLVVRAAQRRRRPALVTAAAVTVGIGAAVLLPLVVEGDADPAYAVTPRDDGTVSVQLRELRNAGDARDLERRLEQFGIPADVTYVPDGKQCGHPRFAGQDDTSSGLTGSVVATGPDGTAAEPPPVTTPVVEAILDPADYQDGNTTLVIEAPGREGRSSVGDPKGYVLGVDWFGPADGPVKPCEIIDAA